MELLGTLETGEYIFSFGKGTDPWELDNGLWQSSATMAWISPTSGSSPAYVILSLWACEVFLKENNWDDEKSLPKLFNFSMPHFPHLLVVND